MSLVQIIAMLQTTIKLPLHAGQYAKCWGYTDGLDIALPLECHSPGRHMCPTLLPNLPNPGHRGRLG